MASGLRAGMDRRKTSVSIDVTTALEQRAGIGRYTRELTRALLALDPPFPISLLAAGSGAAIRDSTPTTIGSFLGARSGDSVRRHVTDGRRWRLGLLLSHAARVPRDRTVGRPSLHHATDVIFPYLRDTAVVSTVHDLTALTTPAWHSPLNRWNLTLATRLMLPRARAIIADSTSTRRDVIRHVKIPAERVTVVPLGVESTFRPVDYPFEGQVVVARHRLTRPFVLTVGTLEPRKNHPRLIAAFRHLVETGLTDYDLVIVGRRGWRFRETMAVLAQGGLGDRIKLLADVPDADLPALYSRAAVFVYPSLYEGFGLPPLEAMACGAPVVVSNVSSLPEVVGEAGLLVDPTDIRAIAAALRAILTNEELSRELSGRGRARAAGFTWEKAARRTLDVYRDALPSTSR